MSRKLLSGKKRSALVLSFLRCPFRASTLHGLHSARALLLCSQLAPPGFCRRAGYGADLISFRPFRYERPPDVVAIAEGSARQISRDLFSARPCFFGPACRIAACLPYASPFFFGSSISGSSPSSLSFLRNSCLAKSATGRSSDAAACWSAFFSFTDRRIKIPSSFRFLAGINVRVSMTYGVSIMNLPVLRLICLLIYLDLSLYTFTQTFNIIDMHIFDINKCKLPDPQKKRDRRGCDDPSRSLNTKPELEVYVQQLSSINVTRARHARVVSTARTDSASGMRDRNFPCLP